MSDNNGSIFREEDKIEERNRAKNILKDDKRRVNKKSVFEFIIL